MVLTQTGDKQKIYTNRGRIKRWRDGGVEKFLYCILFASRESRIKNARSAPGAGGENG